MAKKQKTVRMRVYLTWFNGSSGWRHYWEMELGNAGFRIVPPRYYSRKGGAKRAGNAWLRRVEKQLGVKLTTEWK